MKFTIPLNPVTKKNSSRIVHNGSFTRLLPSKAYCEYESLAGYYIPSELKSKALQGRHNVKCLFYMQTKRNVDLPNLLNAIDDVLVKYEVVKDDNSNIIAGHDGSRVLYDKINPRTEIEITELFGNIG